MNQERSQLLGNGGDVSGPFAMYHRWNLILAETFLLSADAGSDVFLSVTPESLARALDDFENVSLTPDDAREDFRQAVANMYQERIIASRDGLGVLSRIGDDGLPESIALLGLSVLAAYDQARGDEPLGRLRYYEPLSDALGSGMARQYPRGFEPSEFDQLWEDLGGWVLERTGAFLYLPTQTGQHTAYPRLHALLRRVDIEKLPSLFESQGFEPGSVSVPMDRIGRALDGFGRLTPDAQQALQDKRRSAVIEQVARQLQVWDGSVTDRRGAIKSSVQVHMRMSRDRPVFSFLPSRPSGFPDPFRAGDVALEAAEGPYYGSVQMEPSDGVVLAEGFEWRSGQYTLRRPPSHVISLSPAPDFSGLLSQPGLPRGIRSAVLCIAELGPSVARHLESITGRSCRPYEDPGVPEGWKLFLDVVVSRVEAPPSGLEALEVSDAIQIELSGGLRLNRSRTWLLGAPPQVLISGPADLKVNVDETECRVVDGQVVDSPLERAGTHRIRVGRLTRTVKIVAAELSPNSLELLESPGPGVWVTPLPRGSWVVLGIEPTQALRTVIKGPSAAVHTAFEPVWAVRPDNSRGRRRILCLVRNPPNAVLPRQSGDTQLWVDSVRTAQVHLAGFEQLGPHPALLGDCLAAWSSYKGIERRLRRQRGRR